MNNKDEKRKGRADDDVVVYSLSYIYWNPQSTFKMSMSAVYILDLKGKVCMMHFVSYNTGCLLLYFLFLSKDQHERSCGTEFCVR